MEAVAQCFYERNEFIFPRKNAYISKFSNMRNINLVPNSSFEENGTSTVTL
jgi:hypothetical protein